MSAVEPITLQLSALGGQGGGVLAGWLAEAAETAGYPAQMTSIPGVAQRTGATTYYLELFPDKRPAATPVFSLFPDADGLDILAALEPMEAARALTLGLVTGRTTVITDVKRIYSTAEKVIAGDGAVPAAELIEPLRRAAGRVVALDVAAVSGRAGAPGNAVLFGAIQASGVLPFDDDDCRAAIRAKGLAVDASLADFEAGLRAAREDGTAAGGVGEGALVFDPAPAALTPALDAYPEALRPLLGHALARLADYQDLDYARLYLRRLETLPGFSAGAPPQLLDALRETATRLAAWMSYEDVVRVAQLKTRPGRFAGIRGRLELAEDAPLKVVDYLKPGAEELASLLPPLLGRRVARAAGRTAGPGGVRLRLATHTPWGYGLFRLLGSLRPWRRRTYRYAQEQAAIEKWLNALRPTLERDAELARGLAELALLARGYGRVRARGLARLEHLLDDWEARLEADPAGLHREVEALRAAARQDPDGYDRPAETAP
ncbi:MAG: indolepyruvate oxidoreductase subunit beta family protein [Rhodospirillales bacterium]|nr:indolepyruvate oxidoreductase subunit beta family protein [Rhodospirillales bacterium]MDH3790483.1 indolepyruvate oxidoreductase subunit beta family protein [Rhodospirillales bacterium]MDH3913184.1 indolepyruvate oxidoreductase subunit beta family protein [Rhodospirillales bacterium]MDH3918280.1 indolepyruvate oxidoreductase subunit beta family protein [Rhodospirillales bacterium]MDH3969992.1 indolepyruvate oxidoreductase subunit beta family protein [Rhodospirillales bacterium]